MLQITSDIMDCKGTKEIGNITMIVPLIITSTTIKLKAVVMSILADLKVECINIDVKTAHGVGPLR